MELWAFHVFTMLNVMGSRRLTAPFVVAAQMYLLRFMMTYESGVGIWEQLAQLEQAAQCKMGHLSCYFSSVNIDHKHLVTHAGYQDLAGTL